MHSGAAAEMFSEDNATQVVRMKGWRLYFGLGSTVPDDNNFELQNKILEMDSNWKPLPRLHRRSVTLKD